MTTNNIGILDPTGINLNPLTNDEYSQEYKDLALSWSSLPAYKHIHNIINKVENNQVILVVSTTGSGKTVLLPKILLHVLDYKGKIAITLPKQIIAKSAAEYAAKTLDVKIGTYVGYQYKGSSKSGKSANTNLLYATDGTIVAQLLKDPSLSDFNAVIIDEAHERKVQIDFLLYLLKQTVKIRPDFKLIIMSATINKNIFIDYFKGFKFGNVDIGGERTFPIKSIFLDKSIKDNEYIETGTKIINKILKQKNSASGDILFFVTSVNETFESCKKFNVVSANEYCIEVYAGMNQERQDLAQDKNSYKTKFGKERKIVISTNVAESSLTIDGIRYVVDSGLELHGFYDPKLRARILNKSLITRAQAVQRMGRAGRTESGTCYHLYTKDDFENKMQQYPEPTIRVSNIYGECLRLLNIPSIKNTEVLKKTLSEFIEPPSDVYVNDAISQLNQLGLLEFDGTKGILNELGTLMSSIQFDPMQGLSIYMGYNMNCMREVVAIIVMIDAMKGNMSDLFIKPVEEVSEEYKVSPLMKKFINSKKNLSHKYGDHLTLLHIFLKFLKYTKDQNENKLSDWLYKHFLKRTTLEKAKKYYKKVIYTIQNSFSSIKKIHFDNINENSLENRILACISYGYKINIAHKINNKKIN
jgi:pre-mRNA-splicing factor ATP-dependent RNA helicase DHX15/PRP43